MSSEMSTFGEASFSIDSNRIVIGPPLGQWELEVYSEKLGDLAERVVSLVVAGLQIDLAPLVLVLLDLVER